MAIASFFDALKASFSGATWRLIGASLLLPNLRLDMDIELKPISM
jgi:hypothetical protein